MAPPTSRTTSRRSAARVELVGPRSGATRPAIDCASARRRTSIASTGLVDDQARRTTTKVRVVTDAESAGRARGLRDATRKRAGPSKRRSSTRVERPRVPVRRHRRVGLPERARSRATLMSRARRRVARRAGFPLLVDPEDSAPRLLRAARRSSPRTTTRRRPRRTGGFGRTDDARLGGARVPRRAPAATAC